MPARHAERRLERDKARPDCNWLGEALGAPQVRMAPADPRSSPERRHVFVLSESRTFDRAPAVRRYLPNYDILILLDSDAYFYDHNRTIEEVVDTCARYYHYTA